MDNVIEKARELGQTIQESDVFRKLRIAEAGIQGEAAAARLLEEYNNSCAQLRTMMERNAPAGEVSRLSDEIRALSELMRECAPIQRFIEKEAEFQAMMRQVNAVLRYFVTGETEDSGGSGCSSGSSGGGCAGCKGCVH